ncbi:MAG: hypothetical protein FJW96_06850, partial [Actinobacteria bacterium]|nr:hypothetical protein [Actinomycetota bacterium]
MPTVGIDATGVLRVGGRKVFPLGVTLPPPPGSNAPSGKPALVELADAGVNMMRTGRGDWSAVLLDGQLAQERLLLDAGAASGIFSWFWLGNLGNLPATSGSPTELLLTEVVNAFKSHPALGVWKGVDEPRNRFRGDDWIRPAGLVRAFRKVNQLDARHPLVITQAPGSTVAQLTPYRPSFDITGADIYPIAYPPGNHAGTANKGISVVGDVAAIMRQAAGTKPFWMTLQLAWSGVTPTPRRPDVVPRFPSLHQLRFMTWQSIVNGARGLVFFGGHVTQVATPPDAARGWNWTLYARVLKPLLTELTSPAVAPVLVAPKGNVTIRTSAAGIEVATRRAGNTFWVIAVRRNASTSRVTFSGLPRRRDGQHLTEGEVLNEWVRQPPAAGARCCEPSTRPAARSRTGSATTRPASTGSSCSQQRREDDVDTKAVVEHHLDALQAGDAARTLSDYTDDSVLISGGEVYRGLTALRPLFEGACATLFRPGAHTFTLDSLVV